MPKSDWAKAFMAVLVSAVGAVGLALSGIGTDASISDIDGSNWLIAIVAVLGSGGMVALVTNVQGVLGGAIKAIIAFLTTGIGSLIVALNPDDNGVSHISHAEWLTAFTVAAVATGFVYEATEESDPKTRRDSTVRVR